MDEENRIVDEAIDLSRRNVRPHLGQGVMQNPVVAEIQNLVPLDLTSRSGTRNFRSSVRYHPYFNNSTSHSENSDSHYEPLKEGHANANQYRKIRDIEKIVPEFDGQNISISQFIRECKSAEAFVEPSDKLFFAKIVQSKVTGNAKTYLHYKEFRGDVS